MMPSKVHAHCHFGKWHNIEVEDDVTAYLEYPNGATGVFITTTGEAPGTNRFEITGDKGKLVFENNSLTFYKNEMSTFDAINDPANGFGTMNYEKIEIECPGEYTLHGGVFSNFSNAILGLEEFRFPIEQGMNGVVLANAMLLSQWKDSAIELPIDGKEFYELLQKAIRESKVNKDENASGTVQSDMNSTYSK
jgi:predicted dehydrogenase